MDREPSLPWLIALSMVTISSPRTSPTMTRLGFMRSERRTSSAMWIAPWPSELGSRSSNATTLGCRSANSPSPSSRARSTVISRSCGSISFASARSSVVLPGVGGPGDHDVLAGPDRGATGTTPSSGEIVPLPTRVSRKTRPSRARRIDSDGRWHTPITAESREPSGSRRSSCGLAVSNGPAGQSAVGAEDLHQLDELVVGVGDRRAPLLAAVGVADEDVVAAVDVDVLDLGVVEQRLQPADAEQGGVDALGAAPPPRRGWAACGRRRSPRGRSSSSTRPTTARANWRSSSADIGGSPLAASSRRCRARISATSSRSRRTSSWSIAVPYLAGV